MPSPSDLRPGDLMFGSIGGFVPGVLPVALGQLLLADKQARLSWRRWWNVRHVGVVVTPQVGVLPTPIRFPHIIEAMPGGARERALSEKDWTARHVYVRPAYDPGQPFEIGYENRSQGFKAAHAALRYVNTPYSFLDYVSLLAHHLDPVWKLAPEACGSQALARYVRDSGHMICSQLADQALSDAGFHVFDDGRLPQDVTPAALFLKLLEMPGTKHLIPGLGGFRELSK